MGPKREVCSLLTVYGTGSRPLLWVAVPFNCLTAVPHLLRKCKTTTTAPTSSMNETDFPIERAVPTAALHTEYNVESTLSRSKLTLEPVFGVVSLSRPKPLTTTRARWHTASKSQLPLGVNFLFVRTSSKQPNGGGKFMWPLECGATLPARVTVAPLAPRACPCVQTPRRTPPLNRASKYQIN